MSRLFDLKGLVALVTGASWRFGRSLAGALSEAGTELVLTNSNLRDANSIAAEMPPTGQPCASCTSLEACA